MAIRCLITCLLLISEVLAVSLAKTIIAVEGGTIILPCLYNGAALQREKVNVFWKHNDQRIVYDIVRSEVSVVDQDPAYKGRTKSFPNEYAKGNFSIKLSSVRSSDNGIYSCEMTFVEDPQSVQLQVAPTPGPGNKAMEARSVLSSLVFSVLLGYNLL